MRIARISDLRRGHLRAEFVPKLRVESFHRSDSDGCTIIIERPSPDRFSTGPLYICALYARSGSCPPESSCCIEAMIIFRPTPPRTAPLLVPAKVLAKHTLPIWRCTSFWTTTAHTRAPPYSGGSNPESTFTSISTSPPPAVLGSIRWNASSP